MPGAIASIAPTNAPILKRKVPASEDAVPAICGKSSRITAMALDEIMAIQPRYTATPITNAQNPRPIALTASNHNPMTN
ncbi:hypothetical protein D3C79_1009300 [compost metagenome]